MASDNFNSIYNSNTRTTSGALSKGYKVDSSNSKVKVKETIDIDLLTKVLNSNGIFSKQDIDNNQFDMYSRFGYSDPYNSITANREVLFITKPDLNIFGEDDNISPSNTSINLAGMNSTLKANSELFEFAGSNYLPVLKQLQYHSDNIPFMYLLSNKVTSSLELPGISAETVDTASNMYSTKITYRSHSITSDQGHDFTLSFEDTSHLDIYMLAKLYDEYHRLIRLGRIAPKKTYIKNRVLDDMFSMYKFIIGEDGEEIKYWAKVTGIFLKDAPRSDLSEFPQDGIKFSLSFYGHFVDDMKISILSEFNTICKMFQGDSISGIGNSTYVIPTYDIKIQGIDNRWVRYPIIEKGTRKDGTEKYLLTWRTKWDLQNNDD